MPLTPKNRKEEWLQGLVDHETTLTPKNRPEEWMKEIIDASGGGGGGGGGDVLVVHEDEGVLDKTWKEIHDATLAVIKTEMPFGTGTSFISSIAIKNNDYLIYTFFVEGAADITFDTYVASSANDYPVFTEE